MHRISPYKGYEFEDSPRLAISSERKLNGERVQIRRGIYIPKLENAQNYIQLANLRTSYLKLRDKEEKSFLNSSFLGNSNLESEKKPTNAENRFKIENLDKYKVSQVKIKSKRKILRSRFDGVHQKMSKSTSSRSQNAKYQRRNLTRNYKDIRRKMIKPKYNSIIWARKCYFLENLDHNSQNSIDESQKVTIKRLNLNKIPLTEQSTEIAMDSSPGDQK